MKDLRTFQSIIALASLLVCLIPGSGSAGEWTFVGARYQRIVHGCDTRATHALVASSNKRPFTRAGRARDQTSERRRQRDDILERT